MTADMPEVDYVRVEIRSGGRTEIVEFGHDEQEPKPHAQVTMTYPRERELDIWPIVRTVPVGGMTLELKVTGESSRRTIVPGALREGR